MKLFDVIQEPYRTISRVFPTLFVVGVLTGIVIIIVVVVLLVLHKRRNGKK